MKAKKAESHPAKAPVHAGRSPWPYVGALAGALLALFFVYSPSLHGAFQFDDKVLPFTTDVHAPFMDWVRGLRPVLMATYWMNAQLSGDDPTSYHIVNLLIHAIASGLIFLIVRRLLEWSGVQHSRLLPLAGCAAGLFLLHPVQTEAVAYIAGRSECLAAMFVFAAFALFLYRRPTAASWTVALGVLALFGAALMSKEHTVALVGLLLLTDFWWNPGFGLGGIRGNWKLYAPVAIGALAGVFYFRDLILHAGTAGFGLKDFTWYQYFFTQCRALFVYIFQFVLPVNLNADWDFPISKTILDRGAIVGLIALLALAGLAWHYRRRFPLACYGFFVYLVLMAPTSSILPIKDAVAERRLYFSMLGLLLIAVDFLNRSRLDRKQLTTVCSVVLAAAAVGTYMRAAVWADPISLWSDTVAKSPANRRAHFQLAYAEMLGGHPDVAVAEYDRAAQTGKVTYDLLIDWGLAYDALHRSDEALAKFRQAVAMEPSAAGYVNIAKIYAERSDWQNALDALDAAQKIDPNNIDVFTYRGKIYLRNNRVPEAIQQYQKALAIDPGFAEARQDMQLAARMLRGAK